MEDKLRRITERVVRISDDPHFIRQFFPFLGTEEDLPRSTHAHLIYADSPIRFLHGFFMDENDKFLSDEPGWKSALELGPRQDLVNTLRKGKPETFDDLLMVVTFFLYSGKHDMTRLPVKPYVGIGSFTNKVLDEILSKSRGYVVWGYQVERLMAIFERDSGVRRDLLRDFRLLRPNAMAWLSKKRFDDGQSLGDVISERTWIHRPAANPAMGFAFRLANLLFSKESVVATNQDGHRND